MTYRRGAQNDSQPFEMLVTALPADSQIGLIDRLMNRAMSEKPKLATASRQAGTLVCGAYFGIVCLGIHWLVYR